MSTNPIMRVPNPHPRAAHSTTGTVWRMMFVAMSAFWSRLFILGFWIFSRQIGDAYAHKIVPWIGFVVLPWTTFWYAIMWGMSSHKVAGIEWLVVALAFIADIVTWAMVRWLRRAD